MKNSEEAHKVTEQIYKNLNDNFVPNLKELSLCARSYYKALTNVAVAAQSYSEAIMKIGQTAEIRCGGPTQEIGTALHEISKVYKQLDIQIKEKMNSLMNDVSFPLENKLETDFKNMASSFKKYNQEHKAIVIPFEKAQNTLSKMQKKKSRSKYSDKEAQYAQTISKSQMKLYDHRISGLQKAMTEEWKCHCFVMECVCNMLTLDHSHSTKLHSMIAPHIDQWIRLYSRSDYTPTLQIQNMFITGADLHNYTDTQNSDMMKIGSPYDNNTRTFPLETNEPVFTKRPGTQLYSRNSSKLTEEVNIYVQAMHSHDATSDTQLSFKEGDMIKLIGEKSEGWHYGFNISDHKYGWFPLSFTSPISPSELQQQQLSSLDNQPLSSRVKSTGDLLNSNDNHVGMAPRRSSITNSINEGPNSMPPASPSHKEQVQNNDTMLLNHQYQASTNNIPTPPPPPQPTLSYPIRSPYSTSNIMSQFGSSQDNEYQNLSTLQPNNNFETSQKRLPNPSPPLPPPPTRQPEVDYNEPGDFRYYRRNDMVNEKGYGGPN